MLPAGNTRQTSWIEWIIVIVTLGALAAVAIPRLSHGESPPPDAALAAQLRLLRGALEMYAAEHGGAYPSPRHVADALTHFSDASGTIFASRRDEGSGVKFGPYLRQIPALPVNGPRKGAAGIASNDAPGIGWIYTLDASGVAAIRANTAAQKDVRGVAYRNY